MLWEFNDARLGGSTSVGVTLDESVRCVVELLEVLRESELERLCRPGGLPGPCCCCCCCCCWVCLPEDGPEIEGCRLERPECVAPALPAAPPMLMACFNAFELSFIVFSGECPATAGGLRKLLAV